MNRQQQREKGPSPDAHNKVHSADLFTDAANAHFTKHIRTQSKRALEIINATIDWQGLLGPIERAVAQERSSP